MSAHGPGRGVAARRPAKTITANPESRSTKTQARTSASWGSTCVPTQAITLSFAMSIVG